jgi:hypothetical protein
LHASVSASVVAAAEALTAAGETRQHTSFKHVCIFVSLEMIAFFAKSYHALRSSVSLPSRHTTPRAGHSSQDGSASLSAVALAATRYAPAAQGEQIACTESVTSPLLHTAHSVELKVMPVAAFPMHCAHAVRPEVREA